MSVLKYSMLAALVAVGLSGGAALAEPSLTLSFSTNPQVVVAPMPFRFGYYVVGRQYYRYKRGHARYVSDYELARYEEQHRPSKHGDAHDNGRHRGEQRDHGRGH